MKENRVINKLMAFLLLGVIAFSNATIHQQVVQEKNSGELYEVRILKQSNSNGLDVGKAD